MSEPNERELELALDCFVDWSDGQPYTKSAERIAAYRVELEAKHAAEVERLKAKNL